MDCDCKSVFNRLSKADRVKLRAAALTKAVSGFIRDDTKEHPVRYPFYMAYLFVVAAPLPVPLISTLTLAATLAWVRYSKSGYANKLGGRLRDAFNHAALVRDNRDYVYGDGKEPENYRVKTAALAWHTTRRSCGDTARATVYAWNALKKLVR